MTHEFLDKFAPRIEVVYSIFPDRIESEAIQRIAFGRNHVENLSGQSVAKRNAAKHVADNRSKDVISVLPSHGSISLLVPLSIRPSQYRIAQRDFSQLGESAECTIDFRPIPITYGPGSRYPPKVQVFKVWTCGHETLKECNRDDP